MTRPRVTFAIMAGGRGERLWPLVRASRPKVCLTTDGRQSLLQTTVDRMRPAWRGADWLIVTTQEQARAVRRALPPSLHGRVLAEPQGRNTAACITLAALTVAAQDPKRVLVFAPADHWMGDPAAFRRALRTAIRAAAAHDTLVTIGIRPTHPHTGLGYLRAGERAHVPGPVPAYRLAQFIEKPSAELAQRLVSGRRTFWNSGLFIGRAEVFLGCVMTWLPQHLRRLLPLANGASAPQAAAAYQALPAVSFDQGVMAHLRGGLIIEGRFAWADLGSWDVWAQRSTTSAPQMLVGTRNVSVISEGKDGHLVAAVGVRDLVIVQTPDATLVCPAGRAQDVREVVRRLQRQRSLARFR
ncbi:MAG: mannose-1-phosphate guanylyltransferase [Candidatus Omnitrophica bacterium]|nr:mannose-1-phosphate guanylyltransferase [Candidatus Omnitrophota bacterium]